MCEIIQYTDTPSLGHSFGIGTLLILGTEGRYRTTKSQRKEKNQVSVIFGTFFSTAIFGGFATQKAAAPFSKPNDSAISTSCVAVRIHQLYLNTQQRRTKRRLDEIARCEVTKGVRTCDRRCLWRQRKAPCHHPHQQRQRPLRYILPRHFHCTRPVACICGRSP